MKTSMTGARRGSASTLLSDNRTVCSGLACCQKHHQSSQQQQGGPGGGGGGPSRTVTVLLVLLILQSGMYSLLWTRQLQNDDVSPSSAAAGTVPASSLLLPPQSSSHLDDQTNVRIPSHIDGTPMSQEERLRYLELKLNSHLNFGTDPFFGTKPDPSLCHNSSELQEFGCVPGFEGYGDCQGDYDHAVCLDSLPPPRPDPFQPILVAKEDAAAATTTPECLVYDFGVRAQPQFGAVMARVFGCEVHAFDPSPVSIEWWESDRADGLRELGNYHFHPYGAGGVDGNLKLHKYNWGQISILRYPSVYFDCANATEDTTHCRMIDTEQEAFEVPVKTLPTIRKELGHEGRDLDVLKLDVEGSEYAFLEQLLDTQGGCPSYIRQLALEWHHQPWDQRYGEGSSPSINALTTLLHACNLKLFWHFDTWPSNEIVYVKMGLDNIRYSVSSYIRS